MTSRSPKKRRTTPPSTSATRSEDRGAEPLWLPAGWLAAVLTLAAAAPSFGATTTVAADGWRARGSSAAAPARFVRKPVSNRPATTWRSGFGQVRPVAYEDDLAGPALRVAGRMSTSRFDRVADHGGYRVAQQDDSLQEAFSRPFGVEEPDADTADRLFDELPPDPYEGPSIGRPADEPEPDDSRFYPDETVSEREEMAPADPDYSYDDDDVGSAFDDNGQRTLEEERREAYEDCAEGLAELRASRLDSIDLSIRVTGDEGEDYPFACSLQDGAFFAPRCWAEITYLWKASGLCHKPLYFEDVHLERYGHSWGPYLQPLVSGAHFFGRLPVLPYCMGIKTPTECVYTLGHYRPGSCAPYMIDPIPFTWRAAIFQAGATVGTAAILP